MARSRPDRVTLEQIAADFGVHPTMLSKRLRVAAAEYGAEPVVTRADQAELGKAGD